MSKKKILWIVMFGIVFGLGIASDRIFTYVMQKDKVVYTGCLAGRMNELSWIKDASITCTFRDIKRAISLKDKRSFNTASASDDSKVDKSFSVGKLDDWIEKYASIWDSYELIIGPDQHLFVAVYSNRDVYGFLSCTYSTDPKRDDAECGPVTIIISEVPLR